MLKNIRLTAVLFFLFAIYLISYLSDVLIPFVIAALLAYLINPLVKLLESRFKNRSIAIAISLIFLLFLIYLFAAYVVPSIAGEFSKMAKTVSNVIKDEKIDQKAINYIQEDIWAYIKSFLASPEFKEMLNFSNISTAAKEVLPSLWSIFSGTINFIFGFVVIFIIFLYLVFILADYDKIKTDWKALIPKKYSEIIERVLKDFESAMRAYFRSQTLIAAIVGFLFAIGFWIIDLPLGITLGVLIGILNLVPYLQTIAIFPATLSALVYSLQSDQNFWSMMLLVLLVFAVIQIIQDAILTPKIMGKTTGFNAAYILLSLSIWSKLLGFLGLLVALPLSFLLRSYYQEYFKEKIFGEKD
jgi:predicted PurR-regulated permease PerM